jgi:TRAP-type C4-dicarboxylate transport system permease small subunit
MNLIENRLNTILEKILVVILGVMVINVSWQVFSRYVLANPSSFTDELARYLMIWLGVMGTAYVSGKRMHVAIDILPDKLSPKRQVKLKKIINLIIILFATLIFVVGGSNLVYLSYILGQKSAALQIPLYVVYLCIPLSGLCIVFFKMCDIKKTS